VGALHPRICDLLGVGPFAAAAELDLDLVQAADRDLPLYEPVIRLPPLPVDVSLVVPYRVTHQQILATIDEAKIDVLRRVDYVGSFTGDPIPAGHKSVTYRLLFQSAERTLAKEEVLALVDRLVTACRERLGASLRSSTSLT
jgi:phenylalanyl-tRNA synthetase beta chain